MEQLKSTLLALQAELEHTAAKQQLQDQNCNLQQKYCHYQLQYCHTLRQDLPLQPAPPLLAIPPFSTLAAWTLLAVGLYCFRHLARQLYPPVIIRFPQHAQPLELWLPAVSMSGPVDAALTRPAKSFSKVSSEISRILAAEPAPGHVENKYTPTADDRVLVNARTREIYAGRAGPVAGEYLCLSAAGARKWVSMATELKVWVEQTDLELKLAYEVGQLTKELRELNRRPLFTPDASELGSSGTVTGFDF